MLAEIFDRFTQGFEFTALKDAKSLLEETRSTRQEIRGSLGGMILPGRPATATPPGRNWSRGISRRHI